jgi:hypothetical protein
VSNQSNIEFLNMLKRPWDVAASARRTGKRPARLRVSGAGRVNSVPECLRCQLPSTAASAATVNGAFLLRMRTSGGLVQHLARLTITAATAAIDNRARSLVGCREAGYAPHMEILVIIVLVLLVGAVVVYRRMSGEPTEPQIPTANPPKPSDRDDG